MGKDVAAQPRLPDSGGGDVEGRQLSLVLVGAELQPGPAALGGGLMLGIQCKGPHESWALAAEGAVLWGNAGGAGEQPSTLQARHSPSCEQKGVLGN